VFEGRLPQGFRLASRKFSSISGQGMPTLYASQEMGRRLLQRTIIGPNSAHFVVPIIFYVTGGSLGSGRSDRASDARD
jgi:hypothetical protein